jgi:acyl-CoA synthetase (AMP-forming)/AMP-acid ligase II
VSAVYDLWAAAEAAGGARPVLGGPERLTFTELGDCIRTTAAALADDWSVRGGEVVALLAPNGAAFVTGYFAIQQLGAVALPLDARLTDDDLSALLDHAGAVGLLAVSDCSARASRLTSSADRCLPLRLLDTSPSRRAAGPPSRGERSPSGNAEAPSRPAELLYTSGTTAAPKGVIRSHDNVLAAVRNARIAFGYAPDDTIAIAMPLSHSSALTSQLLPVLQAGGRAVLLPDFDAARLIETIAAERVTCVRLVPAMIRLLLAHDEFHSGTLPSLRLLLNSSAPVEPDDYRELKRRFAGIRVLNSYGLTEASTCTVLPDALALTHSESVGGAVEGVQLSVRREDGVAAAPDEEGEVWVAGPHVFVGYHRDAAATAAARAGEWLRTGDVGRLDADGMLFLSGRRDDMINCGGRKVAPERVERCVTSAPGVRDAACTAMPHRVLGQVVHAFVVPDDSGTFDARAVVRHCAGVLPSHMVPFQVTAVTTLPRNAVGKLVRRRLPSAT